MADTDALTLRASFLREAAHLLVLSSPAAASSLGSARDRLIGEAGIDVSSKESDSLRREICRACGNVMIPGITCEIITRKKLLKPRNDEKNKARSRVDSAMLYNCLRCNRETSLTLPSPPRRNIKKTTSAPKAAMEPGRMTTVDTEKLPKTANSSSKQRQKARKGGLQAMLEKNKVQNSAKGGLDLMDFAM